MAENARTLFRHSIPVDGKTSISDKPAMIQVNERVYNLEKRNGLPCIIFNLVPNCQQSCKLQWLDLCPDPSRCFCYGPLIILLEVVSKSLWLRNIITLRLTAAWSSMAFVPSLISSRTRRREATSWGLSREPLIDIYRMAWGKGHSGLNRFVEHTIIYIPQNQHQAGTWNASICHTQC